jgi:hypothetical protein
MIDGRKVGHLMMAYAHIEKVTEVVDAEAARTRTVPEGAGVCGCVR